MEPHEQPFAFPNIAGYRTMRHLDEGSSSNIWVVQDETTDVEIALKIPTGDATARDGDSEWLSLEHEFLVEVFGPVKTDQGMGFLMEYCPGGSVAQVVAVQGPLSVGETITVMAPIADALAFLHASGLTHGDLSPRNILFTAEGKPKLGDYGAHRTLGQSPSSFGTTGFCAPESPEAAEIGVLEPERDIYALGACTWYLLTGRPPNATANRAPLGAVVPEVNDEFARLLEQCLDVDPLRRPSAAQFSQRIFAAGEPTAVELSSSVAPEALKHMLTTQQVAGGGIMSRRRRVGRPSAADKQLLRGRKSQIKAQQKPLPRRIRAALDAAAGSEVRSSSEAVEPEWSHAHRVHGLRHGNTRVAAGAAAGLVAVMLAAGGATLLREKAEKSVQVGRENQIVITAPLTAEGDEGEAVSSQEIMLAAVSLSSLRDTALMEEDLSKLKEVHAFGAPSMAADSKILAGMDEAGLHLEKLETHLSDVAVLPGGTPEQVTLEATSTQSAYRYVDGSGEVVVNAQPSKDVRVRMVLLGEGGAWKLWQAVPVL